MIKGVGETFQNEAKRIKGGFFRMLLGTLVASLLGNVRKRGVIREGEGVIQAGEGAAAMSQERGTVRAGQDF